MLSAIVCTDVNYGIYADGTLLFRIQKDIEHFSWLTDGGILIYEDTVLNSFPDGKPLAGRDNIIISANQKNISGATVFPSLEEAVEHANKLEPTGQHIFVVGGSFIYEKLLPQIGRIYLTKVFCSMNTGYSFPTLSEEEWSISQKGENYYDPVANLGFCFLTYERKQANIKEQNSSPAKNDPLSLESRCRKWIQDKWTMAESINNKCIPNVSAFHEFFKKMLDEYLDELQRRNKVFQNLVKKYFAVNRFEVSDKYPFGTNNEICSSIYNLISLDVEYKDTGITVRSRYYPDPFINIRFQTQEFDNQKNGKPLIGIADVFGYFDGFEDHVLLEKVIELSAQKTFAQRYLEAPEEFRRKFPICPRCGASLDASHFGDDFPFGDDSSHYDYECPTCGWTSSLHGCAKYELAELFAENAENIFRNVAKEQNLYRKTSTELQVISDSINRLVKLYTNSHYERQFIAAREEICRMASNRMKGPSENPNVRK